MHRLLQRKHSQVKRSESLGDCRKCRLGTSCSRWLSRIVVLLAPWLIITWVRWDTYIDPTVLYFNETVTIQGSLLKSEKSFDFTYDHSKTSTSTISSIDTTIGQQKDNDTAYNNTESSFSLHPKTLLEYLTNVDRCRTRHMVMFLWSANGTLNKMTPVKGQPKEDWMTNDTVQRLFQNAGTSLHGKVALLYNNDIFRKELWISKPVVPLMFYTIPYKYQNIPEFVLVPNPYDRNGGSERYITSIFKRLRSSTPITYDQFQQRLNKIVWRGAVFHTNTTRKLLLDMAESDPSTDGWLDVGARSDQLKMSAEDMALKYRYQIDIGGQSGTSWNGLRWKMCASGGLVFKVDTFSKDWWHDSIQPWDHYVPVKADLSDLKKQYEWAESHPRRAYQISQNGRSACLPSSTKEIGKQEQINILTSFTSTPQKIVKEAEDIFNDGNLIELIFGQEGKAKLC